MLYLVATPIGNLGDITLRALEILKNVQLILCEDTKRSRVLLDHYKIRTPLRSYHKHSEKKQEDAVISMLCEGQSIALISDAGSPGINDPGTALVAKCREKGLNITAIPGPCSIISALVQSGLPTERFQFIGFLSKKEKQRKQQIIDAIFYPGVTLFFESPKRLEKTLLEITAIGSDHRIAIVREMTKMHEECLLGQVHQFLGRVFQGEIVVALLGHGSMMNEMPPQKHVQHLMDTYQISKREAIKLSSELKGCSKKEIYAQCIELSHPD